MHTLTQQRRSAPIQQQQQATLWTQNDILAFCHKIFDVHVKQLFSFKNAEILFKHFLVCVCDCMAKRSKKEAEKKFILLWHAMWTESDLFQSFLERQINVSGENIWCHNLIKFYALCCVVAFNTNFFIKEFLCAI